MIGLPFELLIFVALLLLGYGFGSFIERRHRKSIIRRELELNILPAIASRRPPEDRPYAQQLVTGSVVIGSDYFKTFLSGLINLFGGRVTPFESLIDRARREAILRLKQEAQGVGASHVFNVKYETARIATGRVPALEVLAYGTALIPGDTLGGRPGGRPSDRSGDASAVSQA
jgi:uncharacterized protein YbjQ (UPF0145 family)